MSDTGPDSGRRDVADYGFDDDDDTGADEQNGPQVTWTLDLEDAELLHDYLHRNRPGGYQHVHDGLLEAINRARGTELFGRFLIAVDGEQYPDIDRGFVRGGEPTP